MRFASVVAAITLLLAVSTAGAQSPNDAQIVVTADQVDIDE